MPASVLRASVYASEEFATDRERILLGSLEPGIAFLGITADTLAIGDDIFALRSPNPPVLSGVSAAPQDIGPAPDSESRVLSILRRLAELSTNPGLWLAAFMPGIWSLLIWQVRSAPRRRYRRGRHQRLRN